MGGMAAALPPGAAAEAEAGISSYTASTKSSANVADILAADSGDESLRKYKESLLGAAATGDLGDTADSRRLVVTEFRVIYEYTGAPDAVFDLSTPGGMTLLKSKGLKMKVLSSSHPSPLFVL